MKKKLNQHLITGREADKAERQWSKRAERAAA